MKMRFDRFLILFYILKSFANLFMVELKEKKSAIYKILVSIGFLIIFAQSLWFCLMLLLEEILYVHTGNLLDGLYIAIILNLALLVIFLIHVYRHMNKMQMSSLSNVFVNHLKAFFLK